MRSLTKAKGNVLRPDDGAFADYVIVPAHTLLHLPKHISFEDGSTLATPLFTAGYCLYQHLSFPYPGETTMSEPDHSSIFIYGGGTAIGSMQIQLARL
jgi:NADPH:quinone reductase-like Zn-dependent oxidoreductase